MALVYEVCNASGTSGRPCAQLVHRHYKYCDDWLFLGQYEDLILAASDDDF